MSAPSGSASATAKPRPTATKTTKPHANDDGSASAPSQTPAPTNSAPGPSPTPGGTTPAAHVTASARRGDRVHGELPQSRVNQHARLRLLERGAILRPGSRLRRGPAVDPNLLGVNQDPWTGGQGPQDLTASSFQDWSVTATDADPSDAPGEVLTYPDASYNYYELNTAASGYKTPPAQYDLNNITSLTSDFTESMPQISDLNAEAAYDMWLNDWKTEIMVWVDTSPAKVRNLAYDGMTEVGTYTYNGQDFALWRSGSGITGFYVFLLNHNETSGTLNLKAMLETMVSLGYIPATSPLTQIPIGWEISDTGGKPVTFSLSRFDVNLQG